MFNGCLAVVYSVSLWSLLYLFCSVNLWWACFLTLLCVRVHAGQEMKMLQASWRKECERARVTSVQQGQRLDGALQRVTDLEASVSRKEQLILQQKKLLEDVKVQSRCVCECVCACC